ncbi:MAG: tetratricopeptide repeat protein [Acidimicrobiia bacterium]
MTTSVGPEQIVEELEAEREFLLASIRDLDRERDADAIDEVTYRRLSDDYTARAAAVLRMLEAEQKSARGVPPRRSKSRAAVVSAAVVALFVITGVVLWGALRDRGRNDILTGGAPQISPTQQLQLLQDDVARNPESANARRALARYYMQQQQYADALREFDAVAVRDPADPESRAYSGWITYLAGLNDRALDRLNAAIALDPGYPDAYFFRGMVQYRGKNSPGAAISDFERYLQLAPDSPMAEQVRSVLSSARQTLAAGATTVPTNSATK